MTNLRQFRGKRLTRVVRRLAVVSLVASALGLTLLSGAVHAQTFSVIHAFARPNGALPYSGVTIRAGVLYGTTLNSCEPSNCGPGIVYQIAPVGSNWYFTPISLLSAGGQGPQARVLFGPDGHLYGTTNSGGSQNLGLVFNLTPRPTICPTVNCFWTESVLHKFTGNPDGAAPGGADLTWDPMGNIYGTTEGGGSSDLGTVYQMTKSGNGWTETPIYSFTGPDGSSPYDGVILDRNGNLFGTTQQGGLYGAGTVFELAYNGVGWTETVLYNFQNQSDGQDPIAGLVRDSAGNLYGGASDGGSGGGGTVFELSPVGDTWVFTTLYSFSGNAFCGPSVTLAMDNSGNLYGTTYCDGANNLGNVFKLTNMQNGWQYASLHDFTGGTDGAYSGSNVTFDANANLYGTAIIGGNSSCNPPNGCGTVWMIKP